MQFSIGLLSPKQGSINESQSNLNSMGYGFVKGFIGALNLLSALGYMYYYMAFMFDCIILYTFMLSRI